MNKNQYMMTDEDFDTLTYKIKFHLCSSYLSTEQAEKLKRWIDAGTFQEKNP